MKGSEEMIWVVRKMTRTVRKVRSNIKSSKYIVIFCQSDSFGLRYHLNWCDKGLYMNHLVTFGGPKRFYKSTSIFWLCLDRFPVRLQMSGGEPMPQESGFDSFQVKLQWSPMGDSGLESLIYIRNSGCLLRIPLAHLKFELTTLVEC